MRVVPEQITLDEDLRGGARLVRIEADTGEQGRREFDRIGGTLALQHERGLTPDSTRAASGSLTPPRDPGLSLAAPREAA